MRLTPKREEIIRQRIEAGVGWSTEIELLAEIDAMRHNAKVVHNALRLEEVRNNTRNIEAVRALNIAKKALEFFAEVEQIGAVQDKYGNKHFPSDFRATKALDLIRKLEK